jgi:hypothetical protein
MEDKSKSPIKSGWRGDLNGYVENCDNTHVAVSEITLKLDGGTAWALCNLLTDSQVENHPMLEKHQREKMSTLGAALGRLIDHGAANNGKREVIKP